MKRLLLQGVALLALFLGLGAVLYARGLRINLPGVDLGYSPLQPIAFSHRLHCGELEMRCLYCHSAADDGRQAGIPAASTCMNCHRFVHASRGPRDESGVSLELRKLYGALGFDPLAGDYTAAQGRPIEWIKVHDLPDFVSFDHSRHVVAGVACQRCHGPIEDMERVAQVSDLTMGWCVGCHREVGAGKIPELSGRAPSIDCAVCHY